MDAEDVEQGQLTTSSDTPIISGLGNHPCDSTEDEEDFINFQNLAPHQRLGSDGGWLEGHARGR